MSMYSGGAENDSLRVYGAMDNSVICEVKGGQNTHFMFEDECNVSGHAGKLAHLFSCLGLHKWWMGKGGH